MIALIMATLGMIFAAIFSPALKEGMLYWAGIGLSLVATVLHLWIILRLRTIEIRQEFKS